jgi:hypothetical protein
MQAERGFYYSLEVNKRLPEGGIGITGAY